MKFIVGERNVNLTIHFKELVDYSRVLDIMIVNYDSNKPNDILDTTVDKLRDLKANFDKIIDEVRTH